MSVAILDANKFWVSPFMVPSNNTVTIDVEAGGLIDIYLLKNSDEFESFKNGERNFVNIKGQMSYFNRINLASLWGPLLGQMYPSMYPSLVGTTWYLVIVNQSLTTSIPIYWRVHNTE